MRACVLAIVLVAGPALADVSAPRSGRSGDPLRCDANAWEQAPFFRLRNDPRVKAMQARAPGMSPIAFGRDHVLFSSWPGDRAPGSSAVFAFGDGSRVAALPTSTTTLVEDERGGLLGLLALSERRGQVALLGLDGKPLWPRGALAHPTLGWADAASVRVIGGLLLIATFSRYSSGAGLLALDRATGEPRWVAEVEQLKVAHSEYFNDVSLALVGDTVVLTGLEAGGCTVQSFDVATGRRLTSWVKRRW